MLAKKELIKKGGDKTPPFYLVYPAGRTGGLSARVGHSGRAGRTGLYRAVPGIGLPGTPTQW